MDTPYLVFAGETYYPDGGWGDCRGAFADLATAIAAVADWYVEDTYHWYEIVDLRCGHVVQKAGQKYGAWGDEGPATAADPEALHRAEER